MRTQTVAVIGGGLSGLTAAYELQRSGEFNVTVFDAAERCGGVLAPVALTVAGQPVTVDAGAEAILNRRREGIDLVQAVGLGDDIVYPATTHAQIYARGGLHPMPTGTVMGVPTTKTDLTGLFTDEDIAAFHTAMSTPHPPVAEDLSVHELITSRCGQAVADRLVEPLLGGVYAGHATALSIQATLPMVWAAAQKGGALGDTLTAPISAGTAAGATTTPVFAGIRGGVHRLPEALVAQILAQGGTVHTNTAVTRLHRDQGTTPWQISTHSETHTADIVVVALPANHSATLLNDTAPQAAQLLAQIPVASMALVTMVLPAEQLPEAGYSGILVPPTEGLSVKAVTFSSAKWAWVRALNPDHVVVRASLGRHLDDAILDRSDDVVLHTALADLHHILGYEVDPVAHHVTRWRGALPQYNVGHSQRIDQLHTALADHPGLHYTGAITAGVGIPACISAAQNVCTHIRTTAKEHPSR